MDQIHLHHHHSLFHPQQQHHLPQPHGGIPMNNVDVSGGGGVVDRLPQWSVQETKEFLAIRAEMDQNFMETKRNKQLWQLISNAMSDKGYYRSPEQCKCKWKNLVTRYKGCETAEPDSVRQQFPFYKELEAIFTARVQRMVWAEAGGRGGGPKKKTATANVSSEEEVDHHNEEISTDQGERSSRKKVKRSKSYSENKMSSSKKLKEILEEFMKQQIEIETQWIGAFEARERERRMKEMEWRKAMEALENERMMMEQRWREREEERRIREEARAERRDALITSLINKLISRQEM